MRDKLVLLFFLFGLMALMPNCYYENPPEPVPIDPDLVSFKTHVLPIFVQSCAIAECHDGTAVPDLRAENAYRELKKGGYYNLTFPEQSVLYKAVDYSGGLGMPPSGQLGPLDRELILIWIRKGAIND